MELFRKKFWKEKIRTGKTEKKNGHYVYDDGNNQRRVFYREIDGKIYVYKVFNNKGKYERFLNNNPYEDIFRKYKFNEYKISKEE